MLKRLVTWSLAVLVCLGVAAAPGCLRVEKDAAGKTHIRPGRIEVKQVDGNQP